MTPPPELRRRLLIVTRDEYNRARISEPDLLADPFTTVVPVPLRTPWTEVPALMAMEDALLPGMLLTRSRWVPGGYLDTSEAQVYLSIARFNALAAVCQQLGARQLSARELREVGEDGSIKGSLNVRTKVVDAMGDFTEQRLKRLAQSLRTSWTWQTGASNVSAAQRTAEELGLTTDAMVTGLIQQRQWAANPLDRYELEFDVNSEARKELAFAMKLKSVLGRLGPALHGTFERIKGDMQELHVIVEIQF